MRAYIAILAAFMRRLDRWLLLRAPMLWRALPPRWLVLVSLAVIVIAAIPLMLTSIKVPADVNDLTFDTVTIRMLLRYGVAIAFWVWLPSIVGKPVGELAPRRHISTVVAVAIGGFVWLALPSVLTYPQINAIKRVGPNDQELSANLEIVSRFDRWDCVPPDVDAEDIEKLRNVLAYYTGAAPDLKKEQAVISCKSKDFFSLTASGAFYSARKVIETIWEARGFKTDGKNQFNDIWSWPYWWLAVALGLGILTAILSYPTYVWRRTFLRR
ncbi:MAG TPA: hypothetical protein VKE70_38335 [Candidatus Solibacter sp.]|nr:hypothetical protein [Candidatus Solibacter sp.]